MAGLAPKDIDVAELYDCFTPVVIIELEDLGFCPKGEGGRFVEGGRVELGGELPDQYAWRPALALPSGPSGFDVFGDRSGAPVARRMRPAPGRRRQARASPCARWNNVDPLHGDFRERARLMAEQIGKPIPIPTLETRPYWEGCKRHELRIQRCAACGHHQFYPRLYCSQLLQRQGRMGQGFGPRQSARHSPSYGARSHPLSRTIFPTSSRW